VARAGHWVAEARAAFLGRKRRRAFAVGQGARRPVFLQTRRRPIQKKITTSGLGLARLLPAPRCRRKRKSVRTKIGAGHPEKRNEDRASLVECVIVNGNQKIMLDSGQPATEGPNRAHADTWAKALLFSARQLKARPGVGKTPRRPEQIHSPVARLSRDGNAS